MPERRTLDDATLDRLLFDAAETVPWPATPVLDGRPPSRRPRTAWRAAVAAVVTLLVAAGVVGAAGALGIGPLRILFEDSLPRVNVPDTPIGTRLALGLPSAIDDASMRVTVVVPEQLRPPDEVYRSDDGWRASLVWAPRDGLPASGSSGIGLLAMFLAGHLDPGLVDKIVIESRVTIEDVTVRGQPGFWISGEPHVLKYLAGGTTGAERTRLVGNALVWEEDGIVIRLESGLGRDETVALAETMGAP